MHTGSLTSRIAAITAFVLILLLSACAGNPRTVSLPHRVHDADPQVIVHVLNRLGFGPRPGDVGRVAKIGVRAYIEQQLHPGTIPDTELETRLASFQTLHDSAFSFSHEYYQQVVQARKELAASTTPPKPGPGVKAGAGAKPGAGANPGPASNPQIVPAVLRGRTLPIVGAYLEGQTPLRVLNQDTVTYEELRMRYRNQRTLTEMQQAKILRAVYTDRQLEEVLTDFWMNHFNVYAGKVEDYVLVAEMERETIRPYVFGRFRDLLGAVAKNPAMLVYLDNFLNGTPTGKPPRIMLNENYGRELMELHTLGVDGGYTQNDVKEVARCLTGWTVKKMHEDPTFFFDEKRHDKGEKIVLGHRIPAGGGVEDAEMVLDIVARHPSTAHFIATKLARRFVSDTPPKSLVDRAAKVFLQTDGDLRAVVQTIITSREFFSPAAMRAKIKSPFEFIVSALRATGANVVNPAPVVGTIAQLGEPLYFCLPPTGYPDRAEAWINTGALFSRMNIVMTLVSNNLGGVKIDLAQLGNGSPDAARDRVIAQTMVDVSPATRAVLTKLATAQPKPTPAQSLAVVLGAPDFQRR